MNMRFEPTSCCEWINKDTISKPTHIHTDLRNRQKTPRSTRLAGHGEPHHSGCPIVSKDLPTGRNPFRMLDA